MRKFLLLMVLATIVFNVQAQTKDSITVKTEQTAKGPIITETSGLYDWPSESCSAMGWREGVIIATNPGATITWYTRKCDNEYVWCGGDCISYYWKLRYSITY